MSDGRATTIQRRMLWRMSALFIVLLSSVAVFVYWQSRERLAFAVTDSLEAALAVKEDAISQWLVDKVRGVQWLADLEAMVGAVTALRDRRPGADSRAALDHLLQQTLHHRPGWREVQVLSPQGLVLVSSDPGSEGAYRSRENYFTEGRRGPFVQKIYPSPVDYQPTLTLAAPLQQGNGSLLGVMVVHVNLDDLKTIISEHPGVEGQARTYLIDAFGAFISASGFERGNSGTRSEAIDAAMRGRSGAGNYVSHLGEPVVGAYRWLAALDAALIVEIDQADAFAPADELAQGIALIGLVFSAVAILLVHLASRQITRPIRKLTAAAAAVAEGDLSVQAPKLSNDEIGVLADAFNDMTRRLRAQYAQLSQSVEELEHLSGTDNLTQLPNRRELETRLQEWWDRARSGGDHLAVLFIDIDAFKNYNDTYGHQDGDECLRMVARCMAAASSAHDGFAGRYGGEEFVVVLPGLTESAAKAVAQRLCRDVEALGIAHAASDTADCITVSIGVASTVPGSGPPHELVDQADRAMYVAKREGKNRPALITRERHLH